MAARKGQQFSMSNEHRTKIANSKILKCLIEHTEGKDGCEMSPSRVTAGLGLLKKVMPDLTYDKSEGSDGDGKLIFETNYETKPK